MQEFRAFTVDHQSLVTSLQTLCGVSPAMPQNIVDLDTNQIHLKTVKAIWDTGAEVSSISTRLAEDMSLVSLGKAYNCTAAGMVEVNIYAVNILLPNGVNFAMVPVTGNDLGDVDMLIGMDIISQGDFSVTNADGKTTFSFRIPSMVRIDYVNNYFG